MTPVLEVCCAIRPAATAIITSGEHKDTRTILNRCGVFDGINLLRSFIAWVLDVEDNFGSAARGYSEQCSSGRILAQKLRILLASNEGLLYGKYAIGSRRDAAKGELARRLCEDKTVSGARDGLWIGVDQQN